MRRLAGATFMMMSLAVAVAQTGTAGKEISQPVSLPSALRAFVKTSLDFNDTEADRAVTMAVPLAAGERTLALSLDQSRNGMHGGPLWILKQTGESYTLLSPKNGDLGGNMYVVCKAVSHRYHDFRVDEEGHAYEIDLILWRFDGRIYQLDRRTFTDLTKERFHRHC